MRRSTPVVFRKTPIALAVAAFAGAIGISSAAPGDPVTGEIDVTTFQSTTNRQDDPAAAMDADGDFVVAWRSRPQDGSGYGVFARRFNADGTPATGEIPVNTTSNNDQFAPAVAMDTDGDFVVTWVSFGQDGDGSGIRARYFNADGTPATGEVSVNTHTSNNQQGPAVAMDANGDFVVVWHSASQDGAGYGVFARRFGSAGVAESDEIPVNTTTSGAQRLPAIAMDANGDFVIAWESADQDGNGYGVFAQRFDALGAPVEDEIQVNTFTSNSQERPAAAMDANGDFVIAWHSLGGQDGNDTGVFARRFDAEGIPASDEIPVNTTTSNSQNTPAVGMDADGDFVVAWNAFTQDGSGDAVIARRFGADGTPASGEFQVNTTTSNSQNLPSVALDTNGDFVVAWQGYQVDGNVEGVFARLFEGPGDLSCAPVQSTCRELPTASLSFKNSDKPGKDSFKHSASGNSTSNEPGLFGDPTADTDNVLCVYAAGNLLMELKAEAAETDSKGKPAWKINSKSATKFSNSAGNADGVRKISQKPGEKAKVTWSAGKDNFVIPELPLTNFPLVVQNQISSGDCVGTLFDEGDFTQNDAEKAKAKVRIEPD